MTGQRLPIPLTSDVVGRLEVGPGLSDVMSGVRGFFLVETPVGALKMMLYIWGSNKEFGSKKEFAQANTAI